MNLNSIEEGMILISLITLIKMDKDQIIYKLKSAIEDSKLQEFDAECKENIA